MGLKNLLTLKDLKQKQVEKLLSLAFKFKNGKQLELLRDVFVVPVFMEPSTRTMLSFETAGKKLGFEFLKFDPNSSSTLKGETLLDTLKTIEAMGADVAVIRLKQEGILQEVIGELSLSIINAGEGVREHPTQALLDGMTIQEHFGKLSGLDVSIIGDIKHSRVAASFIDLARIFEINLKLFSPVEFGDFQHEYKTHDYNDCVKNSDVVMCLRNQLERHEKEFISAGDYYLRYGMNKERLNSMKRNSILMHPGPFNRNVELDSDILRDPKVKIWNQVENGVYARMAVLKEVIDG